MFGENTIYMQHKLPLFLLLLYQTFKSDMRALASFKLLIY